MFTNSTRFLLPFLKLNGKSLQEVGFINAYIDDALKPKSYKDCIYIHCKPTNKDSMREFITSLNKSHKLYNDVYTVDDGYILVFNFPYYSVLSSFLKGKYSEIDRKYVGNGKIFPRDVVRRGVLGISEIWRILTKDPSKRMELCKELDVEIPKEAELWDIPNIKHETFRYKNGNDIGTSKVLIEESV